MTTPSGGSAPNTSGVDHVVGLVVQPEAIIGPAPAVHHEHAVGWGEDGYGECCLCSENPCDEVTITEAIRHGDYLRWSGSHSGVWLARSQLSDAISAAAPADRPDGTSDAALDAAVDAFHTCWVIVRGSIDEPPF